MARVMVKIPDETDTKPVSDVQAPAAPQPPVSPDPGGVKPRVSKNNLIIGTVTVVVIIVIFMFLSLNNDKKHLKDEVNKLSSSQASTTPQNDALKYQDEISKIVDVPQGITPAAKILSDTEINQLSKDNPIYKSAKNGDAFLLYTYPDKSLFLVVYRPSTHKVVLATLGSQQTSTTPTKTTP